MANTQAEAVQNLEVGKLYHDRGDFAVALEKLNSAAKSFVVLKDFDSYLDCQNIILRMHAERRENDQIMKIKEDLQDLVLCENFELTSATYYTLGICASYRFQNEGALDYFKKALELALSEDNKKDICQAIFGMATCYTNLGRFTDALKEIYNLKVFFEVIDLPELKISVQLLNGKILHNLERHEDALESFWDCFEMLKVVKNIGLQIKVLYRLGLAYQELGDQNLAKIYLQLAERSVDAENMSAMHALIQEKLSNMGVNSEKEFDLILGSASNVVTEKRKGKVDFKNQFILLDLLHLFARNPGRAFSKEELVSNVWKQDYNPSIHDNKIYVTIKRLRKLIEPDYDKPKYVFRGKNGYYLNKSAKVLLEQ